MVSSPLLVVGTYIIDSAVTHSLHALVGFSSNLVDSSSRYIAIYLSNFCSISTNTLSDGETSRDWIVIPFCFGGLEDVNVVATFNSGVEWSEGLR